MADGIRIELDDGAVLRALDRLDRAGGDMTGAMNAIGAHLVQATQRRFERETGPDGRPWAPLSPRTAAKRIGGRRRGTGNKLKVSGVLVASFSHRAGPASVAVGTNVPYAAIHQLGGTIRMPARRQTIFKKVAGKRSERGRFARKGLKTAPAREVGVGAHTIRIPARPYLGIDEADRAEILRIIADHYDDALEGRP